jgi:uncharacterized protein (DUF1800 family)
MNRRSFLAGKKSPKQEAEPTKAARIITSGLIPYSGAWTIAEVNHLLKRTMFGATKSDINYFLSRSMSQAVDELLNPVAPLPAPPLKNYVDTNTPAGDPDLGVTAGQTWINTHTLDGGVQFNRRVSFSSWWMGVMINQDRSIREKMTFFWHNHFSTEANVIDNARYIYKHHNLLRQHSLGNFKTLTREITVDSAMLAYLNGQLNTKTAPDENYSRELQELFTLGKENNPNYTEDDVKTAAKVLTGWRNDPVNNTVLFDPTRHDTTNKTFSSFYGGTTITGRTGATAGDLELDDLLNMIFDKSQEVSRYIVTRLYRWFVYYEIDATTQANVINPLAAQLVSSNWEIKPVLETLFKSEHFYDILNQGCQIKSPVDFTVSLCREYSVVFPTAAEYAAQYAHWTYIRFWGTLMQQTIGDPPDVSGWKAYYQAPNYYEIWINSDTFPKRNQFTDSMVVNGYTNSGKKIIIDPVAYVKTMSNPGDPNILIADIVNHIYRVPLSVTSRNIIKKDILLTGQDQDYYWTNAWNAHIANPADMMAYTAVYTRLRDLLKYFMNLAEYHLA